jgi:hypothetical protein
VDRKAAKSSAQEKLDGEKEAEGVKQVAFAGSVSNGKVNLHILFLLCHSHIHIFSNKFASKDKLV